MKKTLSIVALILALNAYSQESSLSTSDTANRGFGKEFRTAHASPSMDTIFQTANALVSPIRDFISIPHQRRWIVGGITTIAYGGSFIFLNEAWYKDYPRSSFHSFNDAGEWKQVDKIGHAWTAYSTGKATSKAWRWTGMSETKSVLLGTGTSLAYMLSIEYLDGRSAEWGWSWSDVLADVSGSSLFAAQQLAWKEQKISFKFSSHRKKYAASLDERADDLFGKSIYERMLKDYNAQTYWLSFNLNSFGVKAPRWLNLAIGYGAEGMFGGFDNIAYDKNGSIVFDRRDIRRYRQWYLSPDIDLTKMRTGSNFLRTVFFLFNSIKVPAPSLEFSNRHFRLHGVSF